MRLLTAFSVSDLVFCSLEGKSHGAWIDTLTHHCGIRGHLRRQTVSHICRSTFSTRSSSAPRWQVTFVDKQPHSRRPSPRQMTPGLYEPTGEIHRANGVPQSRRTYSQSRPVGKSSSWRRAYIAFGSNVGDRLDMIETACNTMSANPDILSLIHI